ncbi:MAG: undecaprenyldiphospho-muramoylpentapeptide beta-N-acetylglucosaminyltransferase [Xanthomonadaceae bacterium]|nr:undecaprenyldiphospho-muramoylpentapeptide beta-N-acetylglucosaminyltransferase [Xanthomonadaceae bacterium]
MNTDAPVLIMAGGTGGHIFPGIAVAHELERRRVPVIWLGGKTGLETRLVPQHGIALEKIDITGVRGKGLGALLALPMRLGGAVLAARRILNRHAPRSALALGGYAAAPGGIAARLMKIPLVVHEQNRVPGKTNRMLAKKAARVLTGFDGVIFDGMHPGAEWVGNPVRDTIAAIAPPEQRYAGRHGALKLLVLGGSQGAQSLNTTLPQVLRGRGAKLPVDVRHQCGEAHLDTARNAYRAAGIDADVVAFEQDMAAAYAWADLVICRAGALTLAELAAAGSPAILVPFPHAVDDHQTRNAEAMVAAGGARLVAEGADFAARLRMAFEQIGERDRLLAMAKSARTLAKPQAAARIADVCLEVAA